ncbi:hypothetical protein GS495_13065 [Rhodococcus hoagii]|nr:hypothetical protein [Prescottella equi]
MGKKITRGLVLAAAAAGVTIASVGVAQAHPAVLLRRGHSDPGRRDDAAARTDAVHTENGQPGVKWVLRTIMTQGGVTSN